ncbi:MAG: ATP-binding protein [Pontixanthobacter sp.]
MLQLLGDQLIRSPRLAVFELVKNAYDADATEVKVALEGLGTANPIITVEDNGDGMSLEIIRDIWFVPGHEHRRDQKSENRRTNLGRLPMGDKGVGRFAVHRLGNIVELTTRAEGNKEIFVRLDWPAILKNKFLEDARVEIVERDPKVFLGKSTGTRIVVSSLRDVNWSRGDLRRLYRDITSICSPFEGPAEFEINFKAPGRESELEGIPDVAMMMDQAIWKFSFQFDGENFDWNYRFQPPPHLSKKVEGRTKSSSPNERLLLPSKLLDDNAAAKNTTFADQEMIAGIGPIRGEFYVYDRDKKVLGALTEQQLLTRFLNENGGVRVYRDGVRVYNYGEEDDDWLGLDHARFQTPTVRISRNIILGSVRIQMQPSSGLTEKTNREGFVENDAYIRLKAMVAGALRVLETERKIDKDAIRKATRDPAQIEADKITDPIANLRRLAKRHGVGETLEPSIAKLEKNYAELRETMLQAGLSGLGLATVFHEVQHGVSILHKRVAAGAGMDEILEDTRELVQLLNGISGLLRQNDRTNVSARDIVSKARLASMIRFKKHRVALVSPLLHEEQEDFQVKANTRLLVGALTNLLDNSFYWLRTRWPSRAEDGEETPRRIYLGRSDDYEQGPAIVIADTGPGFQDDPDTLTEPFFTRRPEGMGLGLYYVNMVMQLAGGYLVFPEPGDVELPEEFDGSVIALVFPKK